MERDWKWIIEMIGASGEFSHKLSWTHTSTVHPLLASLQLKYTVGTLAVRGNTNSQVFKFAWMTWGVSVWNTSLLSLCFLSAARMITCNKEWHCFLPKQSYSKIKAFMWFGKTEWLKLVRLLVICLWLERAGGHSCKYKGTTSFGQYGLQANSGSFPDASPPQDTYSAIF